MGGVWSSIDKAKNGFWRLNIDVKEIMNTIDGGLTWSSNFVVDGNFNVAKLQSRLDRASHPVSDGEFWWLNLVPKKVVSLSGKQNRAGSHQQRRWLGGTFLFHPQCAGYVQT